MDEVEPNILRPRALDNFLGNDSIKCDLALSIQAAKKRQEPLEHVLLYGGPGLGKQQWVTS